MPAVTGSTAADDEFAPYIGHDEFRSGAPHGRFRIVVNPALARPYVLRRTRVNVLAPIVIGVGAVLAMAGQALPGIMLVALGIIANRLVRQQTAKIMLHLALRDAAVYAEVTSNGMMEVRRAT
jgi:hypothetical protein